MIRILLFGILVDKAGCREMTVEMPGKAMKLSEVMVKVREKCPDLPVAKFVFAVNQDQAGPDTLVKDNDEVAIMPPFAGG